MRPLNLYHFMLGFVLLLGSPLAISQSSDETAITLATEAFYKAFVTSDRQQLAILCADKLSFGHTSGRIENKAQFIDGLTKVGQSWKSFDVAKQTIQLEGDHALVRNETTGTRERDGKTEIIKNGVLMVWQKQDGRWKLLARQGNRL